MDKEVLLDFKEARSHKKVAYVVSACANGKNKSPFWGKSKDKNIHEKSAGYGKVRHILTISLLYI